MPCNTYDMSCIFVSTQNSGDIGREYRPVVSAGPYVLWTLTLLYPIVWCVWCMTRLVRTDLHRQCLLRRAPQPGTSTIHIVSPLYGSYARTWWRLRIQTISSLQQICRLTPFGPLDNNPQNALTDSLGGKKQGTRNKIPASLTVLFMWPPIGVELRLIVK